VIPKSLLIGVTGTPAVGKSTFAADIAKKIGAELIEVNDIVQKFRLFSGKDPDGTKIVRMNALSSKLEELANGRKGHMILVGHLLPDLDVTPDLMVVVRAPLGLLLSRMEGRGYGKEKIRENIIAESVDYCGDRSKARHIAAYEVETDAEKEALMDYIGAIAAGRRADEPKSTEPRRLEELMELAWGENEYGF
jgi:adenylate kinase